MPLTVKCCWKPQQIASLTAVPPADSPSIAPIKTQSNLWEAQALCINSKDTSKDVSGRGSTPKAAARVINCGKFRICIAAGRRQRVDGTISETKALNHASKLLQSVIQESDAALAKGMKTSRDLAIYRNIRVNACLWLSYAALRLKEYNLIGSTLDSAFQSVLAGSLENTNHRSEAMAFIKYYKAKLIALSNPTGSESVQEYHQQQQHVSTLIHDTSLSLEAMSWNNNQLPSFTQLSLGAGYLSCLLMQYQAKRYPCIEKDGYNDAESNKLLGIVNDLCLKRKFVGKGEVLLSWVKAWLLILLGRRYEAFITLNGIEK
ncbi:hypothetical protein BDR26DRAFT_1005019 [Obelidium mucronatum]|nr:hypothetical protein BDR26DRAFT_1005019 [Obelidium mucronatum]